MLVTYFYANKQDDSLLLGPQQSMSSFLHIVCAVLPVTLHTADCCRQHWLMLWTDRLLWLEKVILIRNVMKPAKIRIHWISYEKSIGYGSGCGFVARSKFVSTSYYTYCDLTLLNKFTITTIGNSKLNNRLGQLFVIYKNNCTVESKQKLWIRYDRILSIWRILDFRKSAGFRRMQIWNPSHP